MDSQSTLKKLVIQNYLGVKGPIAIDFEGKNSLLIGRNNSGKTNICSTLEFIRNLSSTGFNMNGSQVDWLSENSATIDIFNNDATEALFSFTFGVKQDLPYIAPFIPVAGLPTTNSHVDITVEIRVRHNQKRLHKISFNDRNLFIFQGNSSAFIFQPGTNAYSPRIRAWEEIYGIPNNLLNGIMYFPSKRGLNTFSNGAGAINIQQLAHGRGLIDWIRKAKSPNSSSPSDRNDNKLIKDFQQQFAEFIGMDEVELSVASDNTGKLNIQLNRGNIIPIEKLGTGVAECLIILLTAKIADRATPQINVVLLEEPELHLHPTLQKKLITSLRSYGIQLICTTHSPTVLNVFATDGNAKTFRVSHSSNNGVSSIPASCKRDLLDVLADIGSNPSDVLLADKVLWVEGSHDVAPYRAWLSKCPTLGNQNIAVVRLEASSAASPTFDFEELKRLNPNLQIILDSEKTSAAGVPHENRVRVKAACDSAGIKCHLTYWRDTESYFTPEAVKKFYPDHDGNSLKKFEPITRKVGSFDKSDGGKIAAEMSWADIKDTDIGEVLTSFTKE